jgi:uncharacterized protein
MATTMGVSEAIETMVERIVSGFAPEKIILFGSQARGDAGPDSDVDLLVVLQACENRKAATISMMKLVADLPIGKDIVVTTSHELQTRGRLASTVLYPAVREGRVVYAR